jgi:DNA-binding MarR family transcriptional regulator/GNAT superfamily N-acetyltransferase
MRGTESIPRGRVEALRAFHRFYTRRIGVLHERPLDSRHSLAESRLLYELARTPGRTASALAGDLCLDAGYLSRLLSRLRASGLVKAQRAQSDGRQALLTLTAAGRRALATLERRAQHQAAELLKPLDEGQQQELLCAAARIEQLLGVREVPAVTLRPHRAGDLGWIVERHGALYAQEYGWDQRFEAMVARIAADFIDRFDPATEACWIAERDGQRLGCVVLVQARDELSGEVEPGVAQLRLLLLEPGARGLGIGRRLVDACERFATDVGYLRIRLWTNSVLSAARGIYVKAGYRLLDSEAHHSFGHDLVGEVWELQIQRPAPGPSSAP